MLSHQSLRDRALADYVLQVLLRRQPTVEGKGRQDDYSYRFIGTYLRKGIDWTRDKHSADNWGKAFERGERTLPLGELTDSLALMRRRLNDGEGIKTGKRKVIYVKDVPTPSNKQILEAIQIATLLHPEELASLGLYPYSQHPLLQQAFINLATMPLQEGLQLPDAYRDVYALSLENSAKSERRFETLEELSSYLAECLQGEKSSAIPIVEDALERLLLQAGTGQARFVRLNDQQQYVKNYMTGSFVSQLSEAVHVNNSLRKRLPILLEKTTQESIGVFPIFNFTDDPKDGWLSHTLLSVPPLTEHSDTPIDHLFSQLPTRSVMRVSGYFHIRLSKDKIGVGDEYQGFDYATHEKMRSSSGSNYLVPFMINTTGIGGTNSLITRILNKALISDIHGLREYFPVAHDLFVKQLNVNQRVLSPVSNHSSVHLCQKAAISKAMRASTQKTGVQRYSDFSSHDPRGEGDYCEFDMVQGAASAAFIARLRAIINTGVEPQTYIYSLLSRVEQEYILAEAGALLSGYPFSSFAMASWLESELLGKSENSKYKDSYIIKCARLKIVETFLVEGAYRKAYRELAVLHQHFKHDSQKSIDWLQRYGQGWSLEPDSSNVEEEEFRIISSQLLARYEVCLARYLVIIDVEAERHEQDGRKYLLDLFDDNDSFPSRSSLIKRAWQYLTRAEQHLTVRLMKYHIIDEIAQAVLQPYYLLLASIYFYRAKLFIWYPRQMAPEGDKYMPPTQLNDVTVSPMDRALSGRLFLLERARVFSACDGHDILYILSTAHQCRAWITAAYTMTQEKFTISGTKTTFNQSQCIEWAKRLLNHALLQYAPVGKRCYHAIKEKSGLEDSLKTQTFGRCQVDSIFLIRERFKGDEPGLDESGKILFLDMEFLALRRRDIDIDRSESDEIIYLFGPKAAALLFSRGLYFLSSDDVKEFDKTSSAKELAVNEWKDKLERCYNLFSYAWSIAGNGCGIDPSQQSGTERHITRNFLKTKEEGVENGIFSSHAASVWDLYPHRMTETSAAAKVFAAACAALRCFSASNSDDLTSAKEDMYKVLDSLPSSDSYELESELKSALNGQPRLNGHLRQYLKRSSEIITAAAESASFGSCSETIRAKRDSLLKDLFEVNAL